MRTLSWGVWRELHAAFLGSDSQPHPSEKMWFPDCSLLLLHRLMSQVPSPVPQPALTLCFTETHLISKPLSPFLDSIYSGAGRLQKSKLHIVIWTCVKMPFMPANQHQSIQGFCLEQPPQWPSVCAFAPALTEVLPQGRAFPLRCLFQLHELLLDKNLGLHPVRGKFPSHVRTSAN